MNLTVTSFKTINYIKDVSKHTDRLLKTFQKINREFNQAEGIDWQIVMSRGKDSQPLSLNFQTLYSITPLREDKEKRNEASGAVQSDIGTTKG